MRTLMILASLVAFCGTANAADNYRQRRAQQVPPPGYYVVRQEPLRQIPIVGTVVYGGLNYAGQLIFSPLELIYGPQR